MKTIHNTLSALILLLSFLIANFGLAIIESGVSLNQLFGETSDFAKVALGVGLGMSMMQLPLVFGAVLISYINAYYNN